MRAFATLRAVRARCNQVSEEVLGAGRARLQIMVDTLETRYQEAYATAGTLSEKARVAVELLDGLLVDFEARAVDRGRAVGAAGLTMIDEGRRVMHEGLEKAQEVVDEGIERAMRAAESLEENIQRAIKLAKAKGLITYEDLPAPFRINEHIVRGYRFTESRIDCLRSVFGAHNELVNIWSHALGFVLMLSLALYCYPSSASFSLSTTADVLIAAVFFFAACQCLACSTVWHTMNGIADVAAVETFACVDYTGISLLIAASIMTTEYTAFYCEPVSRWVYMTMTAILGAIGVAIPWHPTFNGQNMAWTRVAFFVGLGATGFVPVLQICLTRGPQEVLEFYSPIAKSIGVYLVGAYVYATKVCDKCSALVCDCACFADSQLFVQFPERFWPGMFDYFGGSHNLWHLAVLGGIFFHYTAMESFFVAAFERATDECRM